MEDGPAEIGGGLGCSPGAGGAAAPRAREIGRGEAGRARGGRGGEAGGGAPLGEVGAAQPGISEGNEGSGRRVRASESQT